MSDLDTTRIQETVSISEDNISNQDVQEGGLNIFKTSVFVSGVVAGAGVLALPNAVKGSGDVGILLMFLACFMSAYTGIILGRTWLLILKRYPQYRETRARYPYPLIGEITFGKLGRHLVSFAINFSLFGAAVVYLVVSAKNIHSLVQELHGDVHACYWALIVAGALAPFTLLNTPKDFWLLALGATGTTAIACIILLANISIDKSSHHTVKHTTPDFISFSTAFGTMCFAFGGHPSFTTFQEDMREKKKFWKAVIVGYIRLVGSQTDTAVHILQSLLFTWVHCRAFSLHVDQSRQSRLFIWVH